MPSTECDHAATLAAGTWVMLGPGCLVVHLAAAAAPPPDVEAQLGADAPCRPLSTLPLPGGGGVLALFRAGQAPPGRVRLRRGGTGWAEAAPGPGLAALVAAAPRLLGLLAAKLAGPLRLADDAPTLQALLDLARPLAAPATEAAPLVTLGLGRQLWRLPAGGWLLHPAALHRVPEPEAGLVPLPPLPRGALLLPADGPPLALPPPARPPSLPELARKAAAGGPAPLLRQAFLALRRHAAQPWCADAVRDAQVLAMAPPRAAPEPSNPVAAALERALSDHAGGVFLSGWLHDPLGLVRGLTLRGPFGPVPLPMERLFRVTRPDLAARFEGAPFGAPVPRPGFVAHLPDAGPGPVAQWRLEIALGSGDAIELVAGPALLPPAEAREAVLRSVAPLDVGPALLDEALAPAAARLHQAASRLPLATETLAIGPAPADPPVSVVVPLYRNLRFLRHQLAGFARDPLLRRCELVYVLDSPEQRGEAEHLLQGLCGLTGLGVTLLAHARNAGYAAACNSGAAAARAPVLLMLNSDVVPDAPGWLGPMLARLAADPAIACVGPKLMFDDGSLQHAGLYFARGPGGDWFNCHYHKGFPRHHPAACRAREVPGVTGAAMLIRRPAWDAVGGFDQDYVVGDYEDSDLCLRLRRAGGAIWYEPAAELFHFERQSIAQHAGYAGTVAAAYNRRLHHRRWDAAIATLMATFPRAGEPRAVARETA